MFFFSIVYQLCTANSEESTHNKNRLFELVKSYFDDHINNLLKVKILIKVFKERLFHRCFIFIFKGRSINRKPRAPFKILCRSVA